MLVIVAAAVVGLMMLWNGNPPDRGDDTGLPTVERVGTADEVSSTWFCAAADAEVEPSTRHELYVANTGDTDTEVRVSTYGSDGPGDKLTLPVGAHGIVVVDLDSQFGNAGLSAMVESPDGAVAVSHGVVSPEIGDVANCQRRAATNLYFPSQTTLSGTTAQLVLFNPFASDASVDLVAAVADGIRSPTEWAGIVVPAGTTRTVDLAEQVQRRDQFAVTARVRSGRVFAETVQTYGGVAMDPTPAVSGLRLSAPVTEERSSWSFAGGFTDPGATELLIVQNPTDEKVSVNVQVVPVGSVELAPEPFEMSIPAGWYGTLDLSAEGRVPDVGFHSITVETTGGARVVAQRQIRLSGAAEAEEDPTVPRRPPLERGVAASVGVDGSATTWWATDTVVGGADQPLLWIMNRGDSPAEVTIEEVTDDSGTSEVTVDGTIPAGDSLTIPLTTKEGGARRLLYRIESTEPVVVEQLVVFEGTSDLSIVPAFPLVGR